MALSLWTAPRLPSAFCSFACFFQGEEGADLCQGLVLPPSSCLDTFLAHLESNSWKAPCGLTASMFHGGFLTQEAIMRTANSFMPAESNALWSCAIVQKAGGVGSPAGAWLKMTGEMRQRRQCPAVHFSHLHNLFIFKEFPQGCGTYCSPYLVHHYPHYTNGLGFSHCQPFFFLTLKWATCLAAGGKKKPVCNLDTPVLTMCRMMLHSP